VARKVSIVALLAAVWMPITAAGHAHAAITDPGHVRCLAARSVRVSVTRRVLGRRNARRVHEIAGGACRAKPTVVARDELVAHASAEHDETRHDRKPAPHLAILKHLHPPGAGLMLLTKQMDMQNVGGTPGGMRTFLLGLVMIVVGGYLLLNQVTVHGGYWHWGFAGSYGRSFGITLIPLLFGVGILFFDGKSFAGRFLTGLGALFIITGIIVNLDINFRQTSLLNTLIMLILIVGGIGLVVRSVLPMEPKKQGDRQDERKDD
jgi:hypothetical protein